MQCLYKYVASAIYNRPAGADIFMFQISVFNACGLYFYFDLFILVALHYLLVFGILEYM